MGRCAWVSLVGVFVLGGCVADRGQGPGYYEASGTMEYRAGRVQPMRCPGESLVLFTSPGQVACTWR